VYPEKKIRTSSFSNSHLEIAFEVRFYSNKLCRILTKNNFFIEKTSTQIADFCLVKLAVKIILNLMNLACLSAYVQEKKKNIDK
jgi:hypothetical protein